MKKNKFAYTIHNLIAHPLMEILHLIGMSELGDKVHDMTLPNAHRSAHTSLEPKEDDHDTSQTT